MIKIRNNLNQPVSYDDLSLQPLEIKTLEKLTITPCIQDAQNKGIIVIEKELLKKKTSKNKKGE